MLCTKPKSSLSNNFLERNINAEKWFSPSTVPYIKYFPGALILFLLKSFALKPTLTQIENLLKTGKWVR